MLSVEQAGDLYAAMTGRTRIVEIKMPEEGTCYIWGPQLGVLEYAALCLAGGDEPSGVIVLGTERFGGEQIRVSVADVREPAYHALCE